MTELTILVGGFCFFPLALVRNNVVYKVRMRFIDNHWPDGYKALPKYDTMLLNPRYWHLWTVGQWERWAGVSK